MRQTSAGILIYRPTAAGPEFLLVHPGGPYWIHKDEGAWGIPKGEVHSGEDLLQCAKRECQEEIGHLPTGDFLPLTPVRLRSGKIVHAWAIQGNFDPSNIKSNNFTMEWPPRTGKQAEFPEVDRAEFFNLQTARQKINPSQAPLLDELVTLLNPPTNP